MSKTHRWAACSVLIALSLAGCAAAGLMRARGGLLRGQLSCARRQ